VTQSYEHGSLDCCHSSLKHNAGTLRRLPKIQGVVGQPQPSFFWINAKSVAHFQIAASASAGFPECRLTAN
jgi:hypothetical protein